MRAVEDIYSGARWTEVVHVQLDSLTAGEADAGLTAEALSGMHNVNGLGHGRSDGEILISSCTSGVLHIGQLPAHGTSNITVVESVLIDHLADNPTYFADPYATPGDDRSGFLETGLSQAINIGKTQRDPSAKDPVMVTYLKPVSAGRWEKRVLFEDDGTRLRSGSAAVLVAIDPAEESQDGILPQTVFSLSSLSLV